ncbi:MAG TPA: SDR family oxidoreductase [Micromonosporaceae bacterium]
MRILVTGGTGTLGRHVVSGLSAVGHDVALLSRRPALSDPPATWFTGDLRTGSGLQSALDGAEVVVHCATGLRDRTAAARLITAATRASRPHLIYISIVGIDRIPMAYYRTKLAVEHEIMASGLPWTILRATQFHPLVASFARALVVSPVVTVPRGVRFQPIAPAEVADRLVMLCESRPTGRVPDLGGPEINTLDHWVRAFARATGRRRTYVSLPVFGKIIGGLRSGENLTPEHAEGVQTFEEFLTEHG